MQGLAQIFDNISKMVKDKLNLKQTWTKGMASVWGVKIFNYFGSTRFDCIVILSRHMAHKIC